MDKIDVFYGAWLRQRSSGFCARITEVHKGVFYVFGRQCQSKAIWYLTDTDWEFVPLSDSKVLKKIGFERTGCVCSMTIGNYMLQLFHWNPTRIQLVIPDPERPSNTLVNIYIRYVHEFQLALKLCKIQFEFSLDEPVSWQH